MSQGKAKHEQGTTIGHHPDLYPYVISHIRETPTQVRLRDTIATMDRSMMMGAPDEAQFIGWLVSLIQAKRVVEVGVFRGSTTLAMAQQLPDGGLVFGLDVSDEYAQVGKAAWAEAGVADKIDFRVGPAVAAMQRMLDTEGLRGAIDLIFIDADKENYGTYYELGLELLRPGGVIVVDNVLWDGRVNKPIDPEDTCTKAIVDVSSRIRDDKRVHAVMLPIADGAYLVRKL